jgi:hypothetical protein
MSFDTLGLAVFVATRHHSGIPRLRHAHADPGAKSGAFLSGADLMGAGAQTGTGRDRRFTLPMLHRLMEKPAVLRGDEGAGCRSAPSSSRRRASPPRVEESVLRQNTASSPAR